MKLSSSNQNHKWPLHRTKSIHLLDAKSYLVPYFNIIITALGASSMMVTTVQGKSEKLNLYLRAYAVALSRTASSHQVSQLFFSPQGFTSSSSSLFGEFIDVNRKSYESTNLVALVI